MDLELVSPRMEQPVFYFDLGRPECYLVAEQVMTALPVVPEWQPVQAALTVDSEQPIERAGIERAALELGLQPIRWPDALPADSRSAMLAATYAKQIGRGVAFALAAFRQAFAAGRNLGAEETILIAGAACEMHPAALLKSLERSSLARDLDAASAAARDRGVTRLPAIRLGDEVFAGTGLLQQSHVAIQRAAAVASAQS